MIRMPRFDLMRNYIDDLRIEYKRDGDFFRAVLRSPYGKGYYRDNALEYARLLME
jgi:hypothetical protein